MLQKHDTKCYKNVINEQSRQNSTLRDIEKIRLLDKNRKYGIIKSE